MGWNILDRAASLKIVVDDVTIELMPLTWSQRASFAQRLARPSTSLSDKDADIESTVHEICRTLSTVIISIDERRLGCHEFADMLSNIDDMAQFQRIQTAIFGAYRFNENAEKN